jgi:glycosyltransferase involved in cell wall biosynthesis
MPVVDGASPSLSFSLTALVPVYNEVATLEEIISRLERVPIVKQIVVVDDNSRDGTTDVIRRLEAQGRVTAGYHQVNSGKGAALRTAVGLANQDYVVVQDADLEYDPEELIRLVEVVKRTGAWVVYGSRFMGARRSNMLLTHYLGNRGLTLAFNILFGQRITDMETCYKLFKTSFLREIKIDCDRFNVDPELTAKVIRSGHKVIEVPITYTGRPYDSGKKIKPIDAWYALKTLLRYRVWQPASARAAPSRAADILDTK